MSLFKRVGKFFLIVFLAIAFSVCTGCGKTSLMATADAMLPSTAPKLPTVTSSVYQVNQFAAQQEWIASAHAQHEPRVSCDSCHRVENGIMYQDTAWRNPDTGQYETVADGNELCQKCHGGYDGNRVAHIDLSCIDCHDPHGIMASCYTCHKQVMNAAMKVPATPIDGHPNSDMSSCESSSCHVTATQVAQMPTSIHSPSHALVVCVACHDTNNNKVGPTNDGNEWLLWRETDNNGIKMSLPFQSHELSAEVKCLRCHFIGNPWGLLTLDNEKGK